jgi:hypothetical protein
MQRVTRRIVYPEGDIQEIEHALSINQLVGLNGEPLPHPLPRGAPRSIVYRVRRMSRQALKGEDIIDYQLELVWRDEVESIMEEEM